MYTRPGKATFENILIHAIIIVMYHKTMSMCMLGKLKVETHSYGQMSKFSFTGMLNPGLLQSRALDWLSEDIPNFDVGGYVVGNELQCAEIVCKSSHAILSGTPFVSAVFAACDCSIQWFFEDGDHIGVLDTSTAATVVASIRGPCCRLLQAERVALNLLARASGVSTRCNQLRHLAAGWEGHLAATRKTTPGLRLLEKFAAVVGGFDPHRFDLSSLVMLKDNHVDAVGGNVFEAVRRARQAAGFSVKIEVETRDLDEVKRAAATDADVIMLDNFEPEDAREAVTWLKHHHPGAMVEVSGGINENNIGDYLIAGVDIISTSASTQGYPCVDFSMRIIRKN